MRKPRDRKRLTHARGQRVVKAHEERIRTYIEKGWTRRARKAHRAPTQVYEMYGYPGQHTKRLT